eukprot:COSAG06_NODE_2862_length_6156_cov_37.661165_5_plen_80_part_00
MPALGPKHSGIALLEDKTAAEMNKLQATILGRSLGRHSIRAPPQCVRCSLLPPMRPPWIHRAHLLVKSKPNNSSQEPTW